MHDKMPKEKWHGTHHYSDRIHLLVVVFFFFAILVMLWSYFELNKVASGPTPIPTVTKSPNASENLPCTMEAKVCPDGKTFVGRHGPKCKFEKCPGE